MNAVQCPLCRAYVFSNKHRCPKTGVEYTRVELGQIASGEMNEDGSYKPWKAAQTVARLKSVFVAPYKILAYLESGEASALTSSPGISPEQFVAQLKAPPEQLKGREFPNLSGLLDAWREFQPEGSWLFAISGQTTGYKNPIGFVDTAIIEKAIAHHTEQGHEGTI